MSNTKTEVQYDLTLELNFTLEISSDTIEEIKTAIADGDIDVTSVEEYLTNCMIDEVDSSFEASVWLPEVDGEMRGWLCSADRIKNRNATRID